MARRRRRRKQRAPLDRVSVSQKATIKLDFVAPNEPGRANLTLYFICDSYLGCDQEYEFALDVKPNSGDGDDDDAAAN